MRCAYPCCLLAGLFTCLSLQCQYYFSSGNKQEPVVLWELGASAGAANCLTDIGGKNGTGKKFIKDINWNQTQFCAGLFAAATWQWGVALRLEANFGQVKGNDDVLKTNTDVSRNRYLRHLHFKTSIVELALTSEWHLLNMLYRDKEPALLSPFLIAGIGCFAYNPQALYNNVWVDLRPLHTEGQGFNEYPGRLAYKTVTWCVPAGAGIKYDASGLINLRLELLYRLTGTDYLDDVSTAYIDPSLFNKYLNTGQAALAAKLADRSAELSAGRMNNSKDIRGNPANKDAWFSFNFKICIALGRVPRK